MIEILFSLQILEIYPADLPFFLSYIFLILCSLLSVALFHLMTSISEREHQAQIALNHAKLTKEHHLVLREMYDDMMKQRHDSRHHIQTLQQLIEKGNSDAAKAYLDSYKAQIAEQRGYLTGSIAVDALLTAKTLSCKSHGISLRVLECPLNQLPISEIDFCAIVGNLLDNAIEGCGRIQHPQEAPWVSLSFSRVWNMFTIRCENPVSHASIIRHGHGFETTKTESPESHGLGIPSIISIAEKAEGFCTFETQGNVFVAIVTLPYPLEQVQ